MPFNAPFQEIDRPPNIGQANMNFQSGGQQGFDFSQFPQFGQGYGSALGGGSNGYFGQGFGNSNFGQGFGNFNFGQGFGGQMSGGNYGQPLPPNIAQLSQQNNAPPGFGGHAFGTNFQNGNAPEGFLAAQSQHNAQQQASALGITPEAYMQQRGSWGQPLNQQNGNTNAQPLPQTQGPSLSGPFQPINIGQGPSGLNTMNGYSGQDLGHGYATPKAYGPQYGSNIGQGQRAPRSGSYTEVDRG